MNPENTQHPGGNSLRLLRPSIVVLCGPSACGKSTFAKQHFRPTQIISSDWARALVCDDERDQRFNTQAFQLVHFLVEQRLSLNRLCVVDSTALTNQARKDLLGLARKCLVPSTLILFNVPLETCVERDEKRERSVGRAVIERQYQGYEASKGAIRQEGFDQVIEFQGDEAEKVQIEILFRPVLRPQRAEVVPGRKFERPPRAYERRPGGNGSKGPHFATPTVPATQNVPVSQNVPATVQPMAQRQEAAVSRVMAPQAHPPKPVEAAAALGGQTAGEASSLPLVASKKGA